MNTNATSPKDSPSLPHSINMGALHYPPHDNPQEGIDFSWQKTAATFYSNWLDICGKETVREQ